MRLPDLTVKVIYATKVSILHHTSILLSENLPESIKCQLGCTFVQDMIRQTEQIGIFFASNLKNNLNSIISYIKGDQK